MNSLFFIAVVAGIGIGYWLGKSGFKSGNSKDDKEGLIEKQAREKEENMKKIMELFSAQNEVTNNDVEKMLGVSDATASNYLSELEAEGKIVQMGQGSAIYYVLKQTA